MVFKKSYEIHYFFTESMELMKQMSLKVLNNQLIFSVSTLILLQVSGCVKRSLRKRGLKIS